LTDTVVFHHSQGLTDGVCEFAERLRAGGHHVTVPDLYNGRTFGALDDGVAYAEQVGFGVIIERGRLATADLPEEVVYAGFSLGVLPAQVLAQTRPGARGALLFHACVTPSDLGCPWPQGVPVQVHGMDADELFVGAGDLEAARTLAEEVEDAELFLYPGGQHLFADSSLPAYDDAAATLLLQRTLAFLAGVLAPRR
jgi:dienelactone hydrolase